MPVSWKSLVQQHEETAKIQKKNSFSAERTDDNQKKSTQGIIPNVLSTMLKDPVGGFASTMFRNPIEKTIKGASFLSRSVIPLTPESRRFGEGIKGAASWLLPAGEYVADPSKLWKMGTEVYDVTQKRKQYLKQFDVITKGKVPELALLVTNIETLSNMLKPLNRSERQAVMELRKKFQKQKPEIFQEYMSEVPEWLGYEFGGKVIMPILKAPFKAGSWLAEREILSKPWEKWVLDPIIQPAREKLKQLPVTSQIYRAVIPAIDRKSGGFGSISSVTKGTFRRPRIGEFNARIAGKQIQKSLESLSPREKFAAKFYIGRRQLPQTLGLKFEEKQKVYAAIKPLWEVINPEHIQKLSREYRVMYADSMKSQLEKLLAKPMFEEGTDLGLEAILGFNSLKELEKVLTEKVSVEATPRLIRKAMGSVIETPGVSKDIRILAKDLYDSTATTTGDFVKASAKSEKELLYAKLRNTPGFASNKPGPGKIFSKHPAFEDMWISQDADDALRELTDIEQHGQRWFNKWFMQPWKMGKVIMRPATHFRNIFTNVMLNDWGGLSFARGDIYWKAISDFRKGDKGFADFKKLINMDVDFMSNEMTPMMGMKYQSNKILHGMDVMLDLFNRIGEPMGRAYQAEELIFKYAKYLHNIEKGLSKGMAAQDAVKWTFDYGTSTPALRFVRHNIMPFATWQAKVIPLMAETALEHPVRFAKWPLAFLGMQNMSIKTLGITDREWEQIQANLPEYVSKGWFLPMPFRDRRGRLQFINMTYIFPGIGDLSEIQQQGWTWWIQNPAVTILGGLKDNKRFSGAPIYYEWESGSMKLIKTLQYMGQQLLPAVTPGIGTDWMLLQDAFFSANPKAMTPEMAVAAQLGFRTIPFNEQDLARRRGVVRKIFMQQIKSEMKKELRKVSDSNQRDKIIKRYREYIQNVVED